MPKSSKYTKSARGQECQVRIPNVCNHNPETVIFAHLNGAGMGMKHADIHGAYACSDCHIWLDGGYIKATEPAIQNSRADRDLYHLEGMVRTQQIMIKESTIKL